MRAFFQVCKLNAVFLVSASSLCIAHFGLSGCVRETSVELVVPSTSSSSKLIVGLSAGVDSTSSSIHQTNPDNQTSSSRATDIHGGELSSVVQGGLSSHKQIGSKLSSSAPSLSSSQQSDFENLDYYTLPGGWTLVWEDDFSGTSLNETHWNTEEHQAGWVNDELQRYVKGHDTPGSNIWLEDGRLIIEARKESNGEITSGRLNSRHKQKWLYGKFEARAKMPGGNGTWPAIWAMSDAESYGRWPKSGEIDIVEFLGKDPKGVNFTIHCDTYVHSKNNAIEAHREVDNLTTDFHTFGMEWTPDEIRGYVDGTQYYSFKNEGNGWNSWPFDKEFYWLINIAMGGWGGAVNESTLPARMEVEYVRVWQQGGAEQPATGDSFTLFPLTDFSPVSSVGYVPYFEEENNSALAVDPDKYPNGVAAASTEFTGESGLYDVSIATLLENDGEPSYTILVDGMNAGSFKNPESEGGFAPHTHTWKGLSIKKGSTIIIEFNSNSNGAVIMDNGDADWAKGRWTRLGFEKVSE
ncbi:MAG: glycoside hydrolase family 16 protein [Fibrobacterales bacterium]